MENEYIDWLKADFKSDPWVTYRFRKYTANPKRIPWKNHRELKRQYQYNFLLSWIAGAVLTWPVAVFIGRKYKTTWTGVPIVPMQWYKHDFINVSPGVFSRKQFRLYSLAASATMGFLFAFAINEREGARSNLHRNRPDLKPYPAMVKPDEEDDVPLQTMQQALYKKHRVGNDVKQSSWYRFFFPLDADFSV